MKKGDWIRSMDDKNLAVLIVELLKGRDFRWLKMLQDNNICVSMVSLPESAQIEGCLEFLLSETEEGDGVV